MSGVTQETDLERELMWTVQALALPASEQEALFPHFVEVADELAIDFDEAHAPFMKSALAAQLSAEQHKALAAIDDHFETMSVAVNAANGELWTMESLSTSEVWARVRELAKAALQQMGWPLECPPVRGTVIYVGGPQ